jgi:hypothetical protein
MAEERILGKEGSRTLLAIEQENKGIVTYYPTFQWDADAYDDAVTHHGEAFVLNAINVFQKTKDRNASATKKAKFAEALLAEVAKDWKTRDAEGYERARSLSGFDGIPDIAEYKRHIATRTKALEDDALNAILVKIGMVEADLADDDGDAVEESEISEAGE